MMQGETVTASGQDSTSLPKPFRLFLLISFFLDFVCLATMVVNRVRKLPWPYNSPFFPWFHWYDFNAYYPRFKAFGTPGFFASTPQAGLTFMYPAPVALVYWTYYRLQHHSAIFFMTAILLVIFWMAYLLAGSLAERGLSRRASTFFVCFCILLSYPIPLEYLLGNTENVIFLLVAGGIVFFIKGQEHAAAVLFALAGSMKLYPFIFFGLFLPVQRYRAIITGIVTSIICTLCSLWLVSRNIRFSMRKIAGGLAVNREHYMLHFNAAESEFDHSLFALVKRALYHVDGARVPPHLLSAYLALGALFAVLVYLLCIWRQPVLNQVLSLTILAILLPPTSHDYTLLHLYVPLSLLSIYAVTHHRDRRELARLTPLFVCFALLLSMENEFIYRGLGLSGQFKTIVLVVLLVLALRSNFGSRAKTTPDGALQPTLI